MENQNLTKSFAKPHTESIDHGREKLNTETTQELSLDIIHIEKRYAFCRVLSVTILLAFLIVH